MSGGKVLGLIFLDVSSYFESCLSLAEYRRKKSIW